jgi:ATP-binding protein involved in chromosome partitioning
MGDLSQDQVLEKLKRVRGPDLEGDLVSLGLISQIVISGADVMFALTIDPARAEELEPMRKMAQKAIEQIDGVGKVTVALTAEAAAGQSRPAPAPQVHHSSGDRNTPPPPAMPGAAAGPQTKDVPGVRHIIAVASGKGGVGKSTTACNLALGLAANGAKVGILDADIYGPSMPRLLGITGRPQPAGGGLLKPLEGYGLKVMSMGFLVEEDTPMIWRGPMVISAITQMLREVDWGELDVLVVDMPPGTGDAQLTMAQQVPLAGAVIVSTPQDLALIDARKGLNMFRKVDVPVLGVVENMSTHICSACGHEEAIFGHGGGGQMAKDFDIPLLGQLPLAMEIRASLDEGKPTMMQSPDSLLAQSYRSLALRTAGELSVKPRSLTLQMPEIVIQN